MPEFFSTPGGIAVFSVIAAAIVIFIIEVNYKYFAKAALDFLFALIFTVALSPFFIAFAVISLVLIKKHGGGRILKRTPCLGYKCKRVELYSYSLTSFSGESLGGYADFLSKSRLEYLPRLLNVLELKLSFVGIKPLATRDEGFIDDADFERFNAKTGLISPLVYKGGDGGTYEEVFAAEIKYVKRRELFYDIGAVIVALVRLVRGDTGKYLGEADGRDYCEVLLARGEITEEQLEIADKEAM